MANGSHVALPAELREPSSTDKSIEIWIGEVTAAAVLAGFQALVDFEKFGAMTAETREENGTRIAQLFVLSQQAPDEIDFPAVVRRTGAHALHTHYDAAYRACYGKNFPEVVVDGIITDLLEILAKVAATERMLAH